MDEELTFLSYNQTVNLEFRLEDLLDSPLWVTDTSNGLVKGIPLFNCDSITSSNESDRVLDENKCIICENLDDTLIQCISADTGSTHYFTVELYSYAPYTNLALLNELTVYCIIFDEYLNTLNNVEVKVLIDDEVVNTVTTDNNGVVKYKVNEPCTVSFSYGESTSEDITVEERQEYRLKLTCESPVIEYGDEASVVATLTNFGEAVTGETVSYEIKHGETTLDSGSDTTDSNGQITIDYTGTGIGDVNIIVSYDDKTKTYIIEDCIGYDMGVTGHKSTNWASIGTVNLNTGDTGTKISSTANSDSYYKYNTLLTGDFSVEFDLVDAHHWEYMLCLLTTSDAKMDKIFGYLNTSSTHRLTVFDTSYTALTNVDYTHTLPVTVKMVRDGSDLKIYENGALKATTTVSTDDCYYCFITHKDSSRYTTYANLKIKVL